MLSSPRVSIITLTFNRPALLERAIESVQRQTFKDWELLLVRDGNNEEAARIATLWAGREKRVRHLHRPQHGNIAQATNHGLLHSQAEFIAVLDDDDYWPDPEKLARQLTFLDENPGYVACGGSAICIDHEARETMRYSKPAAHEMLVSRALFGNPVLHSSVMYRRSAAEAAGYYDESLAGYQDWDFFLKLLHLGKVRNFPDYWMVYQMWEGGGSYVAQRANTRAALAILARHWRNYPHATAAWLLTLGSFAYARLPAAVHRVSYHSLSRFKKWLLSRRSSVPPEEI